MKKYTVDDVLNLGPCKGYTRKYVLQLFAGRDTITLIDATEMDIPHDDIVWFSSNVFGSRQRVIFACKCAEDAGMSAWAAWDAAWDARDAVRAARYAAWAARDAARAARAAARAAAWDAVRAAEDRQILFIYETILETDGEVE